MYALRDYQQAAVDATLSHFRRSRSPAVLVLPTGAGKSLIIAELARVARGRVLVLAHVKELVEQNHAKYSSYGLSAGIYSAGLNKKDTSEKVIFGSIQSVARARAQFFADFSLVVIDEAHRVAGDDGTQYTDVLAQLLTANPQLCILGLTATPFRLESGWIYQYHAKGKVVSRHPRVFRSCIFEITLREMIERGYLTPPIQIDAPVASYDFSSLTLQSGRTSFNLKEIEAVLKDQSRVTPVIIENIVDIAKDRRGVLIFTASIRHAHEILDLLPPGQAAIVIGDTPSDERAQTLEQFKAQHIKFLVNVSVLTTGFDAPHMDCIAILRPTESVALYQQIVGRGLRLFPGKSDCLVLDYTGVPHDIFAPQVRERPPTDESVPVKVPCPECHQENEFWGVLNQHGVVIEHYGKTCQSAVLDPRTGDLVPCGFRYRFRTCERCGAENDWEASHCSACRAVIPDDEAKLRAAMSLRDAHVMEPDSMTLARKVDAKGIERLEVRYYDLNAQSLSEVYFFSSPQDPKVFYYNFTRMHLRLPGSTVRINSIDEALQNQALFRLPMYIIARKQGKYWKIREKIFR
jgi:DNA repair protein RadD